MSTSIPCPRCGNTDVINEDDKLCPRCLVAMNFDSYTLGETQPHETTKLPSLDELSSKLPDFEIIDCLGRGGMGIVYKARQKSLDRLVAIKILAGEWTDQAKFTERFDREAKTLAKLNHPNIVTVHDCGESQGLFYIVMEFIDGVTLRDIIRDEKLSAKEALKIVPAICDALESAHNAGVIHRDIKPENILLDRLGNVKLVDFGISKMLNVEAEKAGTPAYMPPETQGDHRSDIYALGVVFYELLTGEQPPKDLNRQKLKIDIRIDEIVLRALEKNPDQRYQTVSEFRTVIETIDNPLEPSIPVGKWRLRCQSCGKKRGFKSVGKIQTRGSNANNLAIGTTVSGYCDNCAQIRTLTIEKGEGEEQSVQEIWRWESFHFRSKATLFGYPLINICSGFDEETGKRRTAKGIIAVGDRAVGVVAIGSISFGVISFGGLGIGGLAFGGGALGLLSYGGFTIGLIAAYGGFAIAPIAYGGYAIGYYAMGGKAIGVEILSGNKSTPEGKLFFQNAKQWGYSIGIQIAQPVMFSMIALMMSLTAYGRRKAVGKPYKFFKWMAIGIPLALICYVIIYLNFFF